MSSFTFNNSSTGGAGGSGFSLNSAPPQAGQSAPTSFGNNGNGVLSTTNGNTGSGFSFGSSTPATTQTTAIGGIGTNTGSSGIVAGGFGGFGTTSGNATPGGFGTTTGGVGGGFGGATSNTTSSGGFGGTGTAGTTTTGGFKLGGTGTGTTTIGGFGGFGGFGGAAGTGAAGGFGSSGNSGLNQNGANAGVVQNLSDNKTVQKQMETVIGSTDASVQKEICDVITLISSQQRIIDEIGNLDEIKSQETLDTLLSLQLECERIKANEAVYEIQVKEMLQKYRAYDSVMRKSQQLKKTNNYSEFSNGYGMKQHVAPSGFFEDMENRINERITRISDKIKTIESYMKCEKNMSVVNKEMSDLDRLFDVMEKEYTVFIQQSACVADVVKKMDGIKKRFLELRKKEILNRRKNMALMKGMKDVLSNVLEDPFKQCQTSSII